MVVADMVTFKNHTYTLNKDKLVIGCALSDSTCNSTYTDKQKITLESTPLLDML